tara:strand:+ start:4861 stop:4980 length:120 start_codon:yes stop_codon:yes gene_type:complete
MKYTIECKSPERDPYTQLQKIDTTIGVLFVAAFFIALLF